MIELAAAPDFENSIDLFNSVSKQGRLLTPQSDASTIGKLRKEADRYKELGHGVWYAMQSAVAALTNDQRLLNKCVTNVKAHTSDSSLICFACRSLAVVGRISDAYKLLNDSRIDLSVVDSYVAVLPVLIDLHAVNKLDSYIKLLDRARINYSDVRGAEMIDNTLRITDLGIRESDMRQILDIAGKLVAAAGLTPVSEARYAIDQSVIINFTLNTSPQNVAQLEWDFTGALLEAMPDAPIEKIGVMFSSREA